jgi:hypothetical protein
MAAAAAPQVNVTAPPATVVINNIQDPDDVPRGIESPEGEQAVMNVISRNRRRVGAL